MTTSDFISFCDGIIPAQKFEREPSYDVKVKSVKTPLMDEALEQKILPFIVGFSVWNSFSTSSADRTAVMTSRKWSPRTMFQQEQKIFGMNL